MKNLISRLKRKGWKDREINKAVKIITDAKKNKPSGLKSLEKKVYWILLLLIITANFSISISLIPALIALKDAQLYFIVAVLGLVFGLLLELVIRSIEHFEARNHISLAIIIPLTALANFLATSQISNKILLQLGITNSHNSLGISLFYAGSFVLPYLTYRFLLKAEYYSSGS